MQQSESCVKMTKREYARLEPELRQRGSCREDDRKERNMERIAEKYRDRILPAREALAKQGIYCEHTTAANYAAYLNYCRLYGDTPDTLITMCGAGLKSDH